MAATIRNFAVVLLTIVVGFGAYFFLYIHNREQVLSASYFDSLVDAGEYVSDAFTGLLKNVRNAASIDTTELEGKSLAAAISERRRLIPGVDSLSSDPGARVQDDSGTFTYPILVHGADRGHLAIALDKSGGKAGLVFTIARSDLKSIPPPDTLWGVD